MSTAPDNRTALVTGGSGGIGLELAKCFARDGWGLILVARKESTLDEAATELKELGAPDVRTIAENLTDPQAPQRIYDTVKKDGVKLDALVNNAGFGSNAFFFIEPEKQQDEMLAVNIGALTKLTRLFLPDLQLKKRAYVLNVASTASFLPGPLMAVYYASKAYVLSLSVALANETAGSGVTVTALCPGPTATGFGDRAGVGDTPLFRRTMSAVQVAQVGYRGMRRGQVIVVPGWRSKLAVWGSRLVPRATAARLARRVQELGRPADRKS